jgi:biotin carboxylase
MPTADDRPHLLLISTGWREFREYLLRSIGPRYRLHLFLPAEPTWEHAYVDGWSVLDTLDREGLLAAARELHARNPVDGVLCWDEPRILLAAQVAEALGLPGGDPEMVLRCRDKHRTREALALAGVPQPRSALVRTREEALERAAEFGFPVVLKPRALAGSLGIVAAATPAELAERFAFIGATQEALAPAAWRYEVPTLVEEFADGPEISVDAAVYGGRVHPFCLARKELGFAPYFEEVGHYVDAADPLLNDAALGDLLQATHTALGFTDGITHTEIRLSPAGPRVIEVNARIGGGMIPYLGLRATGIDPGLAAAAVACGRPPDLAADRKLAGGVRFFYVSADDTVISSIRFDDSALPPAVDQLVPLIKPGATVSPPPKGNVFDRIAYATAFGATVAECRAALDAAAAALRVNAEAAARVT